MTAATMNHLSSSQITTFVSCPRKWSYGKREHAPVERVSSNLVFGCAVHDTLADVHGAAMAGDSIDAPALFRETWDKGVQAVTAPIHFTKATASELLHLGQALVAAYVPPAGIIGVEQEIHVELTSDLPPLVGRIDLIRQDGDDLVQEHFTTKNGKNRAIPICDELIDLLRPFHQEAGFVLYPEKPIKAGKRYRWEFKGLFDNLVIAAGLEDWVTPHVMRHTFASLAAQAGISLYKIGQWMGHSSSEVTEIYAHLAAYDSDINRMNTGSKDAGMHLRLVK